LGATGARLGAGTHQGSDWVDGGLLIPFVAEAVSTKGDPDVSYVAIPIGGSDTAQMVEAIVGNALWLARAARTSAGRIRNG
jgi:hypothetical protein